MTYQPQDTSIGGKVSIITTLIGVVILVLAVVVEIPDGSVALANNATTSVTVLNTPPQWNNLNGAEEQYGSSTSTPTNSGSSLTWEAGAYDSSGDNFYLLICKAAIAAVPANGAAPECGGGIANRWARSSATLSNATATIATTTQEYNSEINYWYAYICDGNAVGAACNTTYKTGSGTTSSPFVVNHRPTFTAFVDTSPANPGASVSWYATSSDTDTYGGTGTDTVKLFVCKAADFTGTACGAGGTWGTSVFATATPTTTITLSNPEPDGQFGAYGYIVDAHGTHAALGVQGANSVININNIAPTITGSSISLLDTDGVGNLTLTTVAGETSGFKVEYTVSDQNSCQTASSTAEIVSGLIDVYRSGITQSGCSQSSQYNANNCYPGGAATTSVAWGLTCVASSTAPCLGTSDSDIVFTCTFPLWYLADATDGDGTSLTHPTYFAENWLASAQAGDNNAASSSLVETTNTTDLTSFLAYSVSTTTIAYGGLQPSQDTGTVGATSLARTAVLATGNVGLDETLYGVDMCPGYPAACPGAPTNTIPVGSQRYATSSVLFSAATVLLANPGVTYLTHIQKSTTTGTSSYVTTHWGISVPGTITLSGDYLGQNTIIGVTSQRSFW